MKKINIILWIIFLVLVDQVSKLIIANYFIDTRFDIIENVFGFRTVYNTQYSYFNGLLNLRLGLLIHVVFLFCIEALVIYLYGYYRSVQTRIKLLDVSFIFGQAALICVFLGFFFWDGGILDFIFLGIVTVDFKDLYLNCFVVLFVLSCLQNRKEIKLSGITHRSYQRALIAKLNEPKMQIKKWFRIS